MRITRTVKEPVKKPAETAAPLLSIGMIFKNEIRCLERCMKSLQPLRDTIPCELVMADTGSDDGSREVAERYADILFDFPWINDFSAARNAVMDRCSGEWYLSIDCDEWLDEDLSDLVRFLQGEEKSKNISSGLTVRNYTTKELDSYSDMLGIRMVRLDTGVRYHGEIHESLDFGQRRRTLFALKTVLHHDGYVVEGGPGGRAKHDRNMALLEPQVEKDPKNLRVLLECVESSRDEGERRRYLHRAVDCVKEKAAFWEMYGPPILRYYVLETLNEQRASEASERAELCREWFPDSPFTTIDVAYLMVRSLFIDEKYKELIPWGDRYLKNLAEYRGGNKGMLQAIIFGTLMMTSPVNEREVRILLADAYFHEKRYEEALNTLKELEISELSVEFLRNYVGILMNLQSQSDLDLSHSVRRLWDAVSAPGLPEKRSRELQRAVAVAAGHAFSRSWREKEDTNGQRHAYTLFLPLEDKSETGLAAAMLETEDPAALTEKLLTVEDWSKLTIHALAHALERGVSFPLPGKSLTVEEMDELADRMRKTGDVASLAVESAGRTGTPAELCWSRGLLLSAMREEAERQLQTKKLLESAEITDEVEEDVVQVQRSIETIRVFAEVERKFLPAYYAPGMLTEDNLPLLPPMHRFGWHCVRAFDALDAGDTLGYVRSLKAGLASCEIMQPVVEFLTEHTPELQTPPPDAELRELAEKVKALLAAYPPDDPAVAALKESPAYQRVAHLIEGTGPLETRGQNMEE